MSPTLLVDAALAGFVYGITPGPGVLALLGIGAAQGRGAGARFLSGHLFGDVVWSSIALVAIIGVHAIGAIVFDLLGLVSGGYLLWLGARALRIRGPSDPAARRQHARPFRYGLAFGLTNPKAYPVAIATFTALLSSRAAELRWGLLPILVLASVLGGLAAYAILTAAIGAEVVRASYRRHEVLIVRVSGLMFVCFALNALFHAGQGLSGQRAR